jgi:hypothetical protein
VAPGLTSAEHPETEQANRRNAKDRSISHRAMVRPESGSRYGPCRRCAHRSGQWRIAANCVACATRFPFASQASAVSSIRPEVISAACMVTRNGPGAGNRRR